MTEIIDSIRTKIADELATSLLCTARGQLSMVRAEAAEASGDEEAAAAHEERMLSSNTAASVARERAELVIETAQLCGVHVGDAIRISAQSEALDQSVGNGKTIRDAIAELEREARNVRRGT